jgi:hypothetical protein
MDKHELTNKHKELLEKIAFYRLIGVAKVNIDTNVLRWKVSRYKGNRKFLLGGSEMEFVNDDIGPILGIPSTGYDVRVNEKTLPWVSYCQNNIFKRNKHLTGGQLNLSYIHITITTMTSQSTYL